MKPFPTGRRELWRRRSPPAPREGVRVELERCRIGLGQGVLFVTEDHGGQQVQEAVLSVGPHRMVEPGRGLEDDVACSAAADEGGERRVTRSRCSSAAHLRPEPVRRDLIEACVERAVEWDLDIDLRSELRQRSELVSDPHLDSLDARIGRERYIEHNADRSIEVAELIELRRRTHEPREHERIPAYLCARILGNRSGERKRCRRKQRGVVDQPREQRDPRIVVRLHSL